MPLNKNSLTFPLLGLPRFQWLRIRAMTCKVPTLMLQFYTLSIAVALALQTLSYCPPFWIITPALLLYFYQMQCCPSSSLIAAGCGAMAGFSLFSPATFPNHVCSRNPGPWPHCFLPGQRQQNAHPLPRHQLPPMSWWPPLPLSNLDLSPQLQIHIIIAHLLLDTPGTWNSTYPELNFYFFPSLIQLTSLSCALYLCK